MDNLTVGKNIAKFRMLKDIKASDIAERLGMKEATYTKYERGETAITIDFVQKVSEVLGLDPVQIVSTSPSHILENVQNSHIAIQTNSTFQSYNEPQSQLMLKLMENMLKLNERIITLMEKDKGN